MASTSSNPERSLLGRIGGLAATPFVCILYLIFAILSLFCFVVFGIFFGPSLYYSLVFFDSHELVNKYRDQGVRITGRVVKRWVVENNSSDSGPTYSYHVTVRYRSPTDKTRHSKNLQVANEAMHSQPRLELLVLPEYPKSALLYASLPLSTGEDLAGTFVGYYLPRLVSFGVTAGLNLALLLVILDALLQFLRLNPVINTVIIAAIIAVEIPVSFVVSYFLARNQRDSSLRKTLYGANVNGEEGEPTTYSEMFPSSKNTFAGVVFTIVKDVISFLIGIILIAYVLSLGGGYMLMHTIATQRRQRQLSTKYETTGSAVVGRVVQRSTGTPTLPQSVRVRYEVFAKGRYERILKAPSYVEGSCPPKREIVPVEDVPRLWILPDLPCSARLCKEVELRDKMYRSGCYGIVVSMLVMAFQSWLWCALIPLNIFAFAGIIVSAQLVLGYIAAILHYHYSEHIMLHNARKLPDTSRDEEQGDTANELDDELDDESSLSDVETLENGEVMDTEEEDDMVEEEEDDSDDDGSESADSQGLDIEAAAVVEPSDEDFIARFMGRFPKMDRAFT